MLMNYAATSAKNSTVRPVLRISNPVARHSEANWIFLECAIGDIPSMFLNLCNIFGQVQAFFFRQSMPFVTQITYSQAMTPMPAKFQFTKRFILEHILLDRKHISLTMSTLASAIIRYLVLVIFLYKLSQYSFDALVTKIFIQKYIQGTQYNIIGIISQLTPKRQGRIM